MNLKYKFKGVRINEIEVGQHLVNLGDVRKVETVKEGVLVTVNIPLCVVDDKPIYTFLALPHRMFYVDETF